MDDRRPKDMIGLRNFQGRSSLSLSDDDHPTTWVRRRRVTVESRNKGGHLLVKPTAQGLDGYFATGQVLTGGIHIMGDADAYGTFADRGPFVLNSGFVFNASGIHSSFDGWGQTEAAVRLGYVLNNQGIGCPTWSYTAYTTYSGTKYAGMYSFYFTRATFKINYEDINGVTILPAARFGPANKQQRISTSYAGTVMDTDKQIRPFTVRDYYGGNVVLDFPPYTKDQYPWEFSIYRLSPTIALMKLTYMRSQYPVNLNGQPIPNRIDNAKCPGCEFRFSYDNGTSWSSASSTDLFHEFFDTALPLPPDTASSSPPGSHDTKENAAFNRAVGYLVMQVAPISATKAVAYALVPRVDFNAVSGNYTVAGLVKLGIIDAASATVTETAILYEDDDVDKAWYWMGLQACEPIKGGAMISRTPLVEPSMHWHDHPQPGFTPDAVQIVWQPPMDTMGMNQGGFLALGPNEVGATSYIDGEYVLRSSKDHGATWKRRALVTNNGQAPQEINERPMLTQFAGVSQIRTGNIGSNPMQGAPWICDSTIKAPIL